MATAELALVQPIRPAGAAARFRRYVGFCEVAADLLTAAFAVLLGYAIYRHLGLGRNLVYPGKAVIGVAFSLAVLVVLMLDRSGAYARGNSLLRVRETEQVLRVSAQAFLVVFTVSFFTSYLVSRWLIVIAVCLVPLLLFVQKHFFYGLVQTLHTRGYGTERVLIYGSGSTGRRVFSVLRHSPKLGMEPVAFVDDDPQRAGINVFEMGYAKRRSAAVFAGPVTRELVSSFSADAIIIAVPSIPHDKFIQAVQEALAAGARVSFVPSHFLRSDSWVDYEDLDGVLLASFTKTPHRTAYAIAKRVLDFAGSLVLLLITLPLFALVTIFIRLTSQGPAIFAHERVGQDGQLFRMYKFRTMMENAASYDYSPRASSDPRITRVGRFLRRTSLDELPQLLNVLLGHMSLVGPRPEMPFIVEQYTETHRQRLQVKPGITGLWQLSGDRAYLIHENIEYDLYYIRHRNFFMDVAILLHTVGFAMRGI
jgi:exopolysaccharide biosynthesis polyprenyl glycosylphosphotransferase